YFVADLLGKPLLILRHPDGAMRCFANVCRHRGGPLATESGTGRYIRCRYHAWTYNLDGTLIAAPKFEGVRNFDKANCKLPSYRIESYAGFLFVDLGGTAPSLAEHLRGICEKIAPIDLNSMKFAKRAVYRVKANWKVYIDNYMEGYHITSVHPSLAKIIDINGYETFLDRHHVLQFGPLNSESNPYHTSGAAYYYQVFPNLMLNIMPGRVQINSIIPVGAGECLTIFDYFYSEEDPDKLAQRLKDDLEISEIVQQEDITICEQVQKGLASGTYSKGRICASEELGIWAFQRQLRLAYSSIANKGQ
ncbi:MAG: aromatic ring-hydroxylating dioxygenase subunit alpha, partial [Proteobacteria bacterium]|nr:aromatic ring-hydroxylating dioxygenase subunit alpha [Pseudomonadota bacterium]